MTDSEAPDATEREQKLVDLCFACVLTALDSEAMHRRTTEQRAQWVAIQLRECGFDTEPVGACWGRLKS